MYSEIIICLKDSTDDIFDKQVNMLKERHHAKIQRLDVKEADEYIKNCSSEALFISDDEELLSMAKQFGISTNSPVAMRESYMKAMEMLKAMGVEGSDLEFDSHRKVFIDSNTGNTIS